MRIKKKCLQAKQEWFNKECEDLQKLEQKDARGMHKKVRSLAGKTKTASGSTIRKKDGKLAMDIDDILSRWEEYVKELFEVNRGAKPDITKNMQDRNFIFSTYTYTSIKKFSKRI